ncbi:MAG TPA: LytTR family DNA-binding domain-containing protein [Steroidobacter sp.]|jgi:two-component system response regulator AlgR|nr:LytTR family DNA-binding domain-containing protein [Steroidobacteraceae bacterium]HLS82275.1 LytTR family DNA-binding domain-containing protein [Steroidobacter sp.]
MKILIVDDEPPARERLRRLLSEMEDCQVVGEAGAGEEALDRCGELQPDVVLLDVRMPGLTGIQVARHIDTLEDPPAVIFTTAYDQYAVEAFETEAVGYLLKPVRKEKLAHALRHASRISPSRLVKLAESARIEHRREQICARLGEQLRLIPVGDIYYFLADQKYVTVKHKSGESLIDESLKSLGEEFAPDFVRIHRNALVAEKQISAVERTDTGQYVVRIRECGDVLDVSRRHAGELLRRIRGER